MRKLLAMESYTYGTDLNFEGDSGNLGERGTGRNYLNAKYACRNSPCNPFTTVDNAIVEVDIANEYYDAANLEV